VEYYQKTDIFHPHNLWSIQNLQKPVMYITDVMPLKEFEQIEYYNVFLKVQGFYHEIIVALSVTGGCQHGNQTRL